MCYNMNMRICDELKSASVAIMGMCKNAGKTTVLNSILQGMGDFCMGLTSIGRDGEETDVATATPKPRLYVKSGTVFATAQTLLKYCDTTLEVLDTSGIYTSLGEVILLKAKSDGNIQIAGPSTVEGLIKIHSLMKQYGADKCFFDGAISRKSLSVPSLCDETVLCSGASYSRSMSATVNDTAYFAQLFTLDIANTKPVHKDKYALSFLSEEIKTDSQDAVRQALQIHGAVKEISVNGAVTDSFITMLLTSGVRDCTLTAEDPSRLLMSHSLFQKCTVRNIKLQVLSRSDLRAIAINPFSAYGAGYDANAFYDLMCKAAEPLKIPVFDVMR